MGTKPFRERHGTRIQETEARARTRRYEDRLILLIERADRIRKYEDLLRQIEKGSLDIPGFFKKISVEAAITMADIMASEPNPRARIEAAKDILDRAGYGKTTKIAVGGQLQVDHDTSKLELVNLILSAAKRAGIPGIKVKDEMPELPPPPAPEVIDVKAEPPPEAVEVPDAGSHDDVE